MIIYVDGQQLEVPDEQIEIYEPFPQKEEKDEGRIAEKEKL